MEIYTLDLDLYEFWADGGGLTVPKNNRVQPLGAMNNHGKMYGNLVVLWRSCWTANISSLMPRSQSVKTNKQTIGTRCTTVAIICQLLHASGS